MTIEEEETTQAAEREEAEYGKLLEMVNELRRQRADEKAELNHTKGSTLNNKDTTLEEEVELLLQRFTVPTRNDIEELSRKISELDKKASAVKKNRVSETSR